MARFRAENLVLRDDQLIRFGVGNNNIADSELWWDSSAPHPTTSGDLRLSSTVSGVNPIYDYHLTTKWYVDDAISNASGVGEDNTASNVGSGEGVFKQKTGVDLEFRSLLGAGSITLISGANDITISGSGVTDHGLLTGLSDDDHTQYILATGLRAFTGTVSGVSPTDPNHLTTKFYVDTAVTQAVTGLDWQDSVLSQVVAYGDAVASGTNRYIAPTTSGAWTAEYIYEWTGTSWSGIEPNEGFATWIEDEDIVYFYDDAYPAGTWVKISSVMSHNNLSGLQGGTTDEYYHLTSTMYTDLTSFGGIGDAGSQHHHDGSYYTKSEITTISGDIVSQIPTQYTDEMAQDAVGGIMSGAGTVTVTYDDAGNTITVSGSEHTGVTDHGLLTGLSDDDHLQYVPRDGSRGFLSTVSGVDPTQSYHLTTKSYVDELTTSGGVDRHGRKSLADKDQQITVTFADLGHTAYTVNATLENSTDSPPSIYALIISARTSSSFIADFSGKMDSANYILNWMVIED